MASRAEIEIMAARSRRPRWESLMGIGAMVEEAEYTRAVSARYRTIVASASGLSGSQ